MRSKRSEFDLLVFDWEGTLIDSVGNIVHALQGAFQAQGLPMPTYSLARRVAGLKADEAIKYLAPALEATRIKALVDTYYALYQQGLNRSTLYDGVALWLARLHQAGYLLALATGKSRRGLDAILQETSLGNYFAATRTAEETFSKPHPQMLNEILAVLDVKKQRAVVIGDTVYDLQMATNAGCVAIAMSYGAHDQVRLLQCTCSPLHIFDNFHALGAWLLPLSTKRKSA